MPATAAARRNPGPSERAAITRRNVANGDEPKGNYEEAPPSPARREAPADQRYQQHRQCRDKQGDAGHVHADVQGRTQEEWKIDQHGPVSELDGGQQRGDPGHGRRREHAGIEHRARTAPLLPQEHERQRHTGNKAEARRARDPSRLRRASIARPSEIVSNAIPTGSSRRPSRRSPRRPVSGTARASARQKGMFAKKIQRQPSHEARKPPSVGPNAMATPEITPRTPNARAR